MSKPTLLFGLHASLEDFTRERSECLTHILAENYGVYPEKSLDSNEEIVDFIKTVVKNPSEEKLAHIMKNFWRSFSKQIESRAGFCDHRYLEKSINDYNFALISSFPNELVFKIIQKMNCLDLFTMVLGGDDFNGMALSQKNYFPVKARFGAEVQYFHGCPKRIMLGKTMGIKVIEIKKPDEVKNYLLNPR